MIPRWQPGRQGTGYRKLLLASGKTWDAWLLHYPPGSSVPPHRDPVAGKHWRANVLLWGEDAFRIVQPYCSSDVRRWKRIVTVFRPDIFLHEVRAVSRRRVVLSLGWVR